jgi:hypothetical protein
LWGFEWSSSTYGHLTVIASDNIFYGNGTFSELCEWLNLGDGIAFINHPEYMQLMSVYKSHNSVPSERFVGIELWNQNSGFSYYYYNDGIIINDNNKGYYDELLTQGWRIGPVGSGDNHSADWGTRVDFRTAILAPRLTRNEILSALRARRFYSTLDKNLALSFTVDGNEMGSAVMGNDHTFRVRAFDGNREIFTEVIIFDKNHDRVMSEKLNTENVDISRKYSLKEDGYYYVKITQKDGDEAISSPVWIGLP